MGEVGMAPCSECDRTTCSRSRLMDRWLCRDLEEEARRRKVHIADWVRNAAFAQGRHGPLERARLDRAIEDCKANLVDWRARALVAEALVAGMQTPDLLEPPSDADVRDGWAKGSGEREVRDEELLG